MRFARRSAKRSTPGGRAWWTFTAIWRSNSLCTAPCSNCPRKCARSCYSRRKVSSTERSPRSPASRSATWECWCRAGARLLKKITINSMNDNELKRMASGQCPDELTLQLYLEGETDVPVEELIFHHLAYCRVCADRLEQMRDVKMFCLERLGEEDLREAAHTQRVLQGVQDRLQKASPPILTSRRSEPGKLRARAWWKRFTMAAAAAFAVAMGGFWLISEKQPALSAMAVLDEAEMRERLWEYQQGKVLHWVI